MPVTTWRGALYVDVYVKLSGRAAKRIRRRAPIQTRSAARAFERELLAAEYRLDGKPEKTFADFVRVEFKAYALANNGEPERDRKKKALEFHLLPAFGEMYLRDIGVKDVEAYKSQKLATLKPKTVHNHLSVLRKALALAKEYGEIETVPAFRMPKIAPQKFDFLSFEEAELFLASALPNFRPMLTVAVGTGLRIGELRALRWDNVDLKRGVIHVRESATAKDKIKAPKHDKFRDVPMSEGVAKTLKMHRHLRGPLVFCHGDGSILKEYECKHGPKTACRRAKLRTVGWHVLRHTFASHLAMRGCSMRTLMELMGHGTLAMTQRYAHLSPNVPREAVRLLDLPRVVETKEETG